MPVFDGDWLFKQSLNVTWERHYSTFKTWWMVNFEPDPLNVYLGPGDAFHLVLKPLTGDIIDHPIIIWCFAGNPEFVAFMWMPLDKHNHSNTVVDQVHHLMETALTDGSCPPERQCILTNNKDSSGTVPEMWQRARSVSLASKSPRSISDSAYVQHTRTSWIHALTHRSQSIHYKRQCRTQQDTPMGSMTMPWQTTAFWIMVVMLWLISVLVTCPSKFWKSASSHQCYQMWRCIVSIATTLVSCNGSHCCNFPLQCSKMILLHLG